MQELLMSNRNDITVNRLTSLICVGVRRIVFLTIKL